MTGEVIRLAAFARIPTRLAGIVAWQAMCGGVGIKTLRSDDRHGHLVRIRQRIAYEARESGYSFWQIARAINRDHTTVMYSVKTERARQAA